MSLKVAAAGPYIMIFTRAREIKKQKISPMKYCTGFINRFGRVPRDSSAKQRSVYFLVFLSFTKGGGTDGSEIF